MDVSQYSSPQHIACTETLRFEFDVAPRVANAHPSSEKYLLPWVNLKIAENWGKSAGWRYLMRRCPSDSQVIDGRVYLTNSDTLWMGTQTKRTSVA